MCKLEVPLEDFPSYTFSSMQKSFVYGRRQISKHPGCPSARQAFAPAQSAALPPTHVSTRLGPGLKPRQCDVSIVKSVR